MEDLKNKKLYKIMWLPEENHIFLDIKNEKFISINSKMYKYLSNYVDWKSWINVYKKKYENWLNSDDNSIYNISDEVNTKIINALLEMNKHLIHEKIFYWFDIDRTFNENFIWKYCPISKRKLIQLPDEYPEINSLISPEYPLIFPHFDPKV
jgi:hypothetical protein